MTHSMALLCTFALVHKFVEHPCDAHTEFARTFRS